MTRREQVFSGFSAGPVKRIGSEKKILNPTLDGTS